MSSSEEFTICLARAVQREYWRVRCHTWGSSDYEHVDLAHFFRHGKNSQRHEHATTLSGVCKVSWGTCSPSQLRDNGHTYNKRYYLAGYIYPEYATFLKTIPDPASEKESYFAICQEACRKDVEREFGVLQQRFGIVRYPLITHNMILKSERDAHHQMMTIHLIFRDLLPRLSKYRPILLLSSRYIWRNSRCMYSYWTT
jgi:hypothetical protein